MRRSYPALALLAGSLALAAPHARAAAPVVDGALDPAYGAPLVVQTNLTQFKDTLGLAGGSDGMELDAGYARVANGVLYLMLTGNVLLQPNPIEPGTVSSTLHLFFDSMPGGQNTLRADNDTLGLGASHYLLASMHGLTFDTDFAPDFWIGFDGGGGPDLAGPYTLESFSAELPSNAGAIVTFVGSAFVPGPNPLTGGANPLGIAIALDNSNAAGVAQGCGSGSGAGATTGFECAIPLAAIGNPTGPIKVCAVEMHPWWGMSSQVLGPLPPGSCSLGYASTVNFANLAGNQYFVVDPTASVAPSAPPAGLRLAPAANPAHALTVSCTLPSEAEARLDVIDSGGRRVLTRSFTPAAAGRTTLTLTRPSQLAPGVYFLRLTQGTVSASSRAVITR